MTNQSSIRRPAQKLLEEEDVLEVSEEEDLPLANHKSSTTGTTASESRRHLNNRNEYGFEKCDPSGKVRYRPKGRESPERLLKRHGVISEFPDPRCNGNDGGTAKNVILVIGDGMGWEMVRAGAIAKQVIAELESLGCNTKTGCPTNQAATDAFAGRSLNDYYTEGKGSGLSWQELDGYALVTNSIPIFQEPSDGNHYAPDRSLLQGYVDDHTQGMQELALNECGYPIDFSPLDYDRQGGNMVLWDSIKGGNTPWDSRYYEPPTNVNGTGGFDPTYIMQHSTDSAATATCLATGAKSSLGGVGVNLYEENVPNIVQQALACRKAAGVVTTVPMLHATPAAFVSHASYRRDTETLQESFESINPTFASGVCIGDYYPKNIMKKAIAGKNNDWKFFIQSEDVKAKDFYKGIEELNPDAGDHVMVCLGGDYTYSREGHLPLRGVDSNYMSRWCSRGMVEEDEAGIPLAVKSNSRQCKHYEPEEIEQIPHISKNVEEALNFMGKSDRGFFLMYEQGDIDWSAHDNHMDDLLGTMLDIDESVRLIMDWINDHGGWDSNALYVTADHDHYLTLLPSFPERLASLLIAGRSHDVTPENNADENPWGLAVEANRHEDANKTIQEHLKDFSTWTEDDILQSGHFWGPWGSGGNGWGSHSTRPVPLSYMGDDGCIDALTGKGYRVLGRDVAGSSGLIDQVHLHACMVRNLFGL